MATGDDAIGIFDSGVGGLTVLHALLEALPQEDLVYLGDTGRYPYGTKSAETVTRYSIENVDFLIAKGIKLLVVACNTASSVALEALAARYPVPVVGVIEPGARAAAARTRNGRVGVIGTEATIASGAYTTALRALKPGLEIYTRPCPLLVALAEEGWVEGPVPQSVVETYLATLQKSGIDTLVLGCTHYPLLKPAINRAYPGSFELIDSATTTAAKVERHLEHSRLRADGGEPRHEVLVTAVPQRFDTIAAHLFGEAIEAEEVTIWQEQTT